MKRNILFTFFSLFLVLAVNAQDENITMSPEFITASADLDDPSTGPSDIVGHGFVTNNSPSVKTFVWKRTVEEVPEGWNTAVCDVNLCYFHTVDTMEFELMGNQEGIIDVHAYPGGSPGANLDAVNPGMGRVVIEIYEVGNPDNSASAEWEFILEGTPVGVDEIEAQQIHLFPNPANNHFYLSNSSELTLLQVYNVLGKKMFETQVLEGQRFDVSSLSKGIYFVRLIDDEDEIVKTLKMKKQ